MSKKSNEKSYYRHDDFFSGNHNYGGGYGRSYGYGSSEYGSCGSYNSNYGNYSGRYSDYFSKSFWQNKDNEEDIVKPELDRWMEADVENLVRDVIMTNKFEDQGRFPAFMARDIFKLYYNREDDLKFDIKEGKEWWHYLLSETDNYMMKIITRKSFCNSYILTKAILKRLNDLFNENQYSKKNIRQNMSGESEKIANERKQRGGQGESENQQQSGSGKKQGGDNESDDQNQGGENSSGAGKSQESGKKDTNDKLSPSQKNVPPYKPNQQMEQIKQAMRQGMKDAVREIANKDRMQSIVGLSDHELGNAADLERMKSLIEDIKNIKLSKGDLIRFIKKSIKGMQSTLTGRIKKVEEAMLEADDINDIPEAHLLNVMELIEDMTVSEDIFSMKFNVYVDCSGSMASGCLLNQKTREEIKRMTLAKILLYKMRQMNILNEIRGFETNVYEEPTDHSQIMSLYAGGGTRIDKCIQHIRKSKIPSLIVSDGDDCVTEYDPNAYILCLVSPVHFANNKLYEGTVGHKYIEGKQLVLYRGGKFSYPYIDKNGHLAFKEEKLVEKVVV